MSSFSIDIRRQGRDATLTYQESGRTLEIYLELSGVREYDYVGRDSAFTTWTVPPHEPIAEDERAAIRRRIDAWAVSNRLRLGFGPPIDLSDILQRFTAAGATVTEGKDSAGRKTFTVERPVNLWTRLRRLLRL